MGLADLAPETLEPIRLYLWDRIIEKHEGPETWSSVLEYQDPEFMEINGRHVLLPIGREQYPNITILRVIVSEDRDVLTIFLQDTTWYYDPLWSGFVTVCEKLPGEDFYLATLYHEWMIIEKPIH